MGSLKIKFVIILVFILLGNNLLSQNIKSNSKFVENTKSYLSLNLSFSNDYVFMGRKDSITSPYLFFVAGYQNESGFYSNGSVSYLTNPDENRVDLVLLNVGYNYVINKLTADISATKYFFNEDSYNVLSEVNVNVYVLASYDFSVIDLSLAASTYFSGSSDSDFFLSSEISQDFLTNDQKFQFSPSVGIYFGSQNFYESYYINNRFGNGVRPKAGNGKGAGSGTIENDTSQLTLVIEESEKFSLMAAELSLPMWYIHNSFAISFVPSLVFPFNERTIIVDSVEDNENLKETFYWRLGCSYRFN